LFAACLQGLDVAADFATRLGLTEDAERYSTLSASTTSRYNSLWYHADGAVYQDGYPISQILALQGGFAGDNSSEVFDTLVQVGC
jgi:GH15 family glucan-1,4-alpha-glucosidase